MGASSGTGTLAKQGAGTLVLNGADTLAGDTTVTAGTLKQGAPSVLPNGAGVGNTVVNGTLDMAGLSGTVNGLSGASSGIIDTSAAGSPSLTVTGNGTFSGVIKNTAGSLALNMNGSGKQLTLGGVNTYTGSTTVTAGTLQQGVASAIPGGSLSVAASANLDLDGSGITVDGLTGGGTIDSTAAGTMTVSIGNSGGGGTFSGAIKNTSGTVNFVKNGVGTEILTGPNTYSGTTACNAGQLQISTGGSINGTTLSGSGFVVNGGTLISSGTTTLNAVNTAFSESSGNVTFGTLNGNVGNDGTLWQVTGGNFTATTMGLGRSGSHTTAPTASAPVAGSTGEWLLRQRCHRRCQSGHPHHRRCCRPILPPPSGWMPAASL